MRRRPVVVTGMGVVSAFGLGLQALEPVFEGRSAIKLHRVGELPGACEVLAARLSSPLPEGLFDRRVGNADRVTQMAVFAAHEAVGMAGLGLKTIGMLAWGTGYGGASTLDDAYIRWLFGKQNLAGKVSPLTVPKAMTHASAAGIAAWFGLSCPVMTYSCACASSAVAIGEAMLAIEYGRCEVAIVGGSEALIVPGVVKAWEALGALAKPDADANWRGPFDQQRSGLVLGEGAACLVLESAAHAAQRGAKVLAKCLGYAQVNDPECVTQPHAAPQMRTMLDALRHADVGPKQVCYVNAHATGTRTGDQSEIDALNAVLQESGALISSTKGATGHLMGAAGAMEALISIHALRTQRCPPNVTLQQRDTEIRFYTPDKPQALPRHGVCLSNSFAFGGTNVSLVFSTHE